MKRMLDRDELRILNAFSEITVDTKNLERKIENHMRYNTRKPAPRPRLGLILAAALLIVAMLGGTVYAASVGAFDRFIERHEEYAPFVPVVDPVETYVVDQGIRVEVIAAQTFGYNAIMYLSVSDVSGQNRITPYASIIPSLDMSRDDDRLSVAMVMGGQEALYFDSETNTAYFQIELQEDFLIPDIMDIIIFSISLDSRSTNLDFPIALSSLTAAPVIPNPSYIPNRDFPTWCAEYILAPTMGQGFPSIPGDGWISNAAIMDGNLHVQLANPRAVITEDGGRTAFGNMISGAELIGPNGEIVAPIDHSFLQVNADLQALSMYEQQNMELEDIVAWLDTYAYDIIEVVFPVDVTALDSYTLTLLGMFEHSIAGNWSMTIYTDETYGQVRTSTQAVTIGAAVIETVMVTPLGVSFSGHVNGGISQGVGALTGVSVSLETPDGIILLQENPGVGFSEMYGENATINGFARADAPVDVAAVTAVLLGDVRVVVE